MRSAIQDREVHAEHRPCRLIRHAWDYTTVERQGRYYIQGLVCIRCQSESFLKISMTTGETKSRRYRYADGYLLKGGGSLTPKERGELRLIEVTGHSPRRRRGQRSA